jgi:hypothetical protein
MKKLLLTFLLLITFSAHALGNASSAGQGAYDVSQNDWNWGNATQLFGGLAGLGGNAFGALRKGSVRPARAVDDFMAQAQSIVASKRAGTGLVDGFGDLVSSSKRKIYRELNEIDKIRLEQGLDILPAGKGGSLLDQVQGRATKYISASESIAGTSKFRSGFGLIEIDLDVLIKSKIGIVDHKNVLNAAKKGFRQDVLNVIDAEEVLIKGAIPFNAIKLIK